MIREQEQVMTQMHSLDGEDEEYLLTVLGGIYGARNGTWDSCMQSMCFEVLSVFMLFYALSLLLD